MARLFTDVRNWFSECSDRGVFLPSDSYEGIVIREGDNNVILIIYNS